MKKILSILLAVCFLMSVTAAAVSADSDHWKHQENEKHHGHWEHHKELRHHHKDKDHHSDWDEVVVVNVFVIGH
jgi:Ni/Co efflux regulator RcnB